MTPILELYFGCGATVEATMAAWMIQPADNELGQH